MSARHFSLSLITAYVADGRARSVTSSIAEDDIYRLVDHGLLSAPPESSTFCCKHSFHVAQRSKRSDLAKSKGADAALSSVIARTTALRAFKHLLSALACVGEPKPGQAVQPRVSQSFELLCDDCSLAIFCAVVHPRPFGTLRVRPALGSMTFFCCRVVLCARTALMRCAV